MTVRRELHEFLAKRRCGNPALGIIATGAYLDELPAEAEIAARRILALAKAITSDVALRPGAAMMSSDGIEKDMRSHGGALTT